MNSFGTPSRIPVSPAPPEALASDPMSAIARSMRDTSSTVLAIGPTQLSVPWHGSSPLPLTRPVVGLSPTTPQKDEGVRIEPPPSVPSDAYESPDETADADPLEEPPHVRPSPQGLTASP